MKNVLDVLYSLWSESISLSEVFEYRNKILTNVCLIRLDSYTCNNHSLIIQFEKNKTHFFLNRSQIYLYINQGGVAPVLKQL